MSKKYLYIVEHFQPFPSSEYGGIWNVIAKDDNECFNLIVNEDNNQYSEHYNKLYANIIKAPKFSLVDDEESRIIDAFLT
jgi:hypothetical protein